MYFPGTLPLIVLGAHVTKLGNKGSSHFVGPSLLHTSLSNEPAECPEK